MRPPHPRRRRPLLLAAGLLALAAVAVPLPTAARADFPEPSFAPIAWELDFAHRDPRRIVVQGRAYWYVPYTLTNNTDEERAFFPVIEMVTREAQTVPALDFAPKPVLDAIRRGTRLPIERPREMLGRMILLGEDQAVSSVAVFPEPLDEMGTFDVYFGGLSGETAFVTGRDGEPLTDADGVPIRVFKTKRLTYRVRGDAVADDRADPTVLERDEWVMR